MAHYKEIRSGSRDVPVAIRSRIVEVDIESTIISTIVRVTASKREGAP